MDIAWTALALSLKVAAWATALNLLLGIGTGYLLARTRFPGRELLDALLTLPMVMPPTVLGYYLLVLLGRRGTLGIWLQDNFGINLIFTWQGAVIASTVVAFPLVFKPARAAFEAVDGQLEQAARAGLKTRGKATTVEAITAPCQVKMRLMPKLSCSQMPRVPRRPSSTSR